MSGQQHDPELPAHPYSEWRARTDDSIRRAQEGIRLAEPGSLDLARAIVNLGRAAERRRGARSVLIESTDTVAQAMREQLRTGDRVTIHLAAGTGSRPVTYYAARAREKTNIYEEQDALIRQDNNENGILGVRGKGFNWEWVPGRGIALDGHIATDEERRDFIAEAAAVVKEFQVLLDAQARDDGLSAGRATKLTPR